MKEMNEDELIKMMVGRSLTNIFPPPVCEPDYSKVVFEAKNLTDNDGKLKDVSFQVFKGEVLGIAGLQGHGQTELLNAISGLYPLTKGGDHSQWKDRKDQKRKPGHPVRRSLSSCRP